MATELFNTLKYEELVQYAKDNNEEFWDLIGQTVYWHKKYDKVIDNPVSHRPNWFVGGKINVAYNCLNKALEEGYGKNDAIIHECIYQKMTRKISYLEFYEQVIQVAGLLKGKFNLKKGDRVIIYLPLIPECVFAILACMMIGVTYCPIFGGFPLREVAVRINAIKPQLIITSNIGYHDYKTVNYVDIVLGAMNLSEPQHHVSHCLVLNRPNSEPVVKNDSMDPRIVIWNDVIYDHEPCKDVEYLDPSDPLFVIFTSGSTGTPKGLVIPNSAIVSLKYSSMFPVRFVIGKSKLHFSDFGWIVGQSIMTFCCFLARSCTILHEGEIVDKEGHSRLPEILLNHKVFSLFIPPTKVRQLRSYCVDKLDLNYPDLIECFTGGEPCDRELITWIKTTLKCDVFNSWGQTELGGIGASPCLSYPGGFKYHPNNEDDHFVQYIRQIPGVRLEILDERTGEVVGPNTIGHLVIKLPVLPSLAMTILDDDERFYKEYFEKFPGYYDTHDVALLTEEGYLHIVGRSSDHLKVATVKINTGHLEKLCKMVEEVDDVTIVGVEDPIIGEFPFGFITIKPEYQKTEKMTKEQQQEMVIGKCINCVVDYYGDIAQFRGAIVVDELPLTTTGKKSRMVLKELANKKSLSNEASFEKPDTLPNIIDQLNKLKILDRK